jgi:predicted acyltransferase
MTTPSSPAPASTRLVSLDALRGFDMFWILGADALFTTLAKVFDIAPLRLIADQLEHKEWDGFAFYDLIFPLFVFMAGVSIVFSLNRLIESGGRAAAVKRVLGRGALLFVIALFYAGGLSTKWPDIRVLGVLQRIALAYTGAGLLFCFFRPRALAAIDHRRVRYVLATPLPPGATARYLAALGDPRDPARVERNALVARLARWTEVGGLRLIASDAGGAYLFERLAPPAPSVR